MLQDLSRAAPTGVAVSTLSDFDTTACNHPKCKHILLGDVL